jgi:STE24 endopeptidase
MALIAVGTLLTGPVSNLVSRKIEARADVHALELTRDPGTFIEAQQRLARTNLSDLDPNPVAVWLFATHPSTTQRIALAREWERLRG